MTAVVLADGILDSIPPGPGLIAVAALLAGVALYLVVRRKGAPIVRVLLLILAITVVTGYLSAGSPQPPKRVTIRILAPAAGEVVPAGRPVPVLVQVKGA